MLIVILSGFVPFITRQWIFVILQLAGVVWVCLRLLLHIIKGKRCFDGALFGRSLPQVGRACLLQCQCKGECHTF